MIKLILIWEVGKGKHNISPLPYPWQMDVTAMLPCTKIQFRSAPGLCEKPGVFASLQQCRNDLLLCYLVDHKVIIGEAVWRCIKIIRVPMRKIRTWANRWFLLVGKLHPQDIPQDNKVQRMLEELQTLGNPPEEVMAQAGGARFGDLDQGELRPMVIL